MARWADVAKDEPGFAAEVQHAFDAFTHKTVATLRADGSPRISGTECKFLDGDLWFGSMPGAVKAKDLLRDPRFALHCGTGTASGADWRGDAKLAGRAVAITDLGEKLAVFESWGGELPDPGASYLFRADLSEVVMTGLNAASDGLVIRVWQEGRGLRSLERS
ncbi:pyridoxamine 5'-phosphate oxidase family protein [Uniformispora flossi]|uniref:Pyridoxamine 5'-phosphate oxidase family protein n=1 Tax=Yinghuangia aomiensis TaxID=676205 RepID=A0ABP9HNZ8_9ACTN